MNYKGNNQLVLTVHKDLFSKELQYAVNQVMSTFLGIEYELCVIEGQSQFFNNISLGYKGKFIKLQLNFFDQFLNGVCWLSPGSLPKLPLERTNNRVYKIVDSNDIIVLYGNNQIKVDEDGIELGIDIFGSIFFMLSRYEELVCPKKDSHDRFPFVESIAFKEGIVMRPIVDEYVELLWSCISHLWPGIRRSKNESKTFISCDVDFIEDDGVRFPGIIKRVGADLFKRKSIKEGVSSLKTFFDVTFMNKVEKDPFNTFDFMMSECEKNDLKMAFYFIPRNSKESIDGNYDIEGGKVLGIIKDIIKRGHEVGYHGSYNSYNNLERTVEEVNLLRKVYKKAGGNPSDIKGGRQHYLRWQTGVTEQNWVNAGLEYDSTLGYAEHVGFRCGTSQEYEFYDCVNRQPLGLIIRPLVCMEVSMFSDRYMDLSYMSAFETVVNLYNEVKLKKGKFTLLWHNSSFNSPVEVDLFKKIIAEL